MSCLSTSATFVFPPPPPLAIRKEIRLKPSSEQTHLRGMRTVHALVSCRQRAGWFRPAVQTQTQYLRNSTSAHLLLFHVSAHKRRHFCFLISSLPFECSEYFFIMADGRNCGGYLSGLLSEGQFRIRFNERGRVYLPVCLVLICYIKLHAPDVQA